MFFLIVNSILATLYFVYLKYAEENTISQSLVTNCSKYSYSSTRFSILSKSAPHICCCCCTIKITWKGMERARQVGGSDVGSHDEGKCTPPPPLLLEVKVLPL